MRGKNRYLAVLAVLALVGAGTSFFGCSSNDAVAPPPSTPTLSGQPLTSATMEQAAAVSANEVEFFNDTATIFASLVVKLPTPAAPVLGTVPRLPVPLGVSGLCLSGATLDTVIFNDNDNNSLPSPGDTLTVTLQNCAFAADGGQSVLSGAPNPAIKFTITDNVVGPVIIGTLDINLTSVSAFDNTDSTTIKGSMRASFSALSFPAADIILGQINGTAANTFATIVETSGGNVAFGCFDVKLNFPDVAFPFNFTTSVRGVAKINNLAIMQLGDYAVASDPSPLNFVGGIPFSGQLKLLSFDNRAASGLSPCYGSVTGTTSELVTALGDSAIRLDTFKNTTWSAPVDNTINTTWGALTF